MTTALINKEAKTYASLKRAKTAVNKARGIFAWTLVYFVEKEDGRIAPVFMNDGSNWDETQSLINIAGQGFRAVSKTYLEQNEINLDDYKIIDTLKIMHTDTEILYGK